MSPIHFRLAPLPLLAFLTFTILPTFSFAGAGARKPIGGEEEKETWHLRSTQLIKRIGSSVPYRFASDTPEIYRKKTIQDLYHALIYPRLSYVSQKQPSENPIFIESNLNEAIEIFNHYGHIYLTPDEIKEGYSKVIKGFTAQIHDSKQNPDPKRTAAVDRILSILPEFCSIDQKQCLEHFDDLVWVIRTRNAREFLKTIGLYLQFDRNRAMEHLQKFSQSHSIAHIAQIIFSDLELASKFESTEYSIPNLMPRLLHLNEAPDSGHLTHEVFLAIVGPDLSIQEQFQKEIALVLPKLILNDLNLSFPTSTIERLLASPIPLLAETTKTALDNIVHNSKLSEYSIKNAIDLLIKINPDQYLPHRDQILRDIVQASQNPVSKMGIVLQILKSSAPKRIAYPLLAEAFQVTLTLEEKTKIAEMTEEELAQQQTDFIQDLVTHSSLKGPDLQQLIQHYSHFFQFALTPEFQLEINLRIWTDESVEINTRIRALHSWIQNIDLSQSSIDLSNLPPSRFKTYTEHLLVAYNSEEDLVKRLTAARALTELGVSYLDTVNLFLNFINHTQGFEDKLVGTALGFFKTPDVDHSELRPADLNSINGPEVETHWVHRSYGLLDFSMSYSKQKESNAAEKMKIFWRFMHANRDRLYSKVVKEVEEWQDFASE